MHLKKEGTGGQEGTDIYRRITIYVPNSRHFWVLKTSRCNRGGSVSLSLAGTKVGSLALTRRKTLGLPYVIQWSAPPLAYPGTLSPLTRRRREMRRLRRNFLAPRFPQQEKSSPFFPLAANWKWKGEAGNKIRLDKMFTSFRLSTSAQMNKRSNTLRSTKLGSKFDQSSKHVSCPTQNY